MYCTGRPQYIRAPTAMAYRVRSALRVCPDVSGHAEAPC